MTIGQLPFHHSMPAATVPAACAAAPTIPTFRIGDADCPYKGSLAWAAALQSSSYLIRYVSGRRLVGLD